MKKVNILGTEYTIKIKKDSKRLKTLKADGICDHSIKEIIVGEWGRTGTSIRDLKSYQRKVMRHEIIHAFLYESGLWECSGNIKAWGQSEEITDWIALQFPKMQKAFEEADCL